MRPRGSRRELIWAGVVAVLAALAFAYFIFFLSDPITEWLLEVLSLA